MTEGFERFPERTRDECGDAGPIARAAPDMVERVAQASARAFMATRFPEDHMSSAVSAEEMRSLFRKIAHAAIEAMREPSDEMRAALFDAWGGEDKDHQAFCVGVAYVAHKQMIDAALAVAPKRASPRQVVPPIREDSK